MKSLTRGTWLCHLAAEVGEKVYMSSALSAGYSFYILKTLMSIFSFYTESMFYVLYVLNKIALQMKNDAHKYLCLFATEYTQKLWPRPTHS